MSEPTTNPPADVPVKILLPWAVFGVVLVAAIVGFFVFADRVPSLLQALTDR